jgi:hypothetical protein
VGWEKSEEPVIGRSGRKGVKNVYLLIWGFYVNQ